ncbi:MAG: hypothetical protein HYZ00_03515, partial [Candidatus Hydrogenedentes bacterium]|nr:hypothetical protein [Candidatus Hydrogenedentota bacterium]
MSAAVMEVLAGCATTTGGDQFQNTVYDMHRRVVKLENTLEGTMTQLNETTATLTARVGENDEQTRRIGSLLEENQARLDGIAQELSEFKSTLYRRWGEPGASGPAVGPSPEVTTGTPTIEVPSTVTPTETTQSVVVAPPPAPPAPAASGDHQTAYQRAQKAWIDEDYNQALELFSEYLTQY